MLAGRKIILGVTGSIAAYKAAALLRLFVKEGADVTVITTEAARRFVADLTFSNLSRKPVFSDLWSGSWTEHVHLGMGADLFVVAPATAHTLAKMAHGMADDALTAVYLAARCPVMVAPAMDADMYLHPATTENFKTLTSHGVIVLPSGTGDLASGLEGPGRMQEPEEILEAAKAVFAKGPLSGKKVLITAGPTREPIDPVRYISNHSSGKMGYALAAEAVRLGAEVTLVSGPVEAGFTSKAHLVKVETAQQMYEAVISRIEAQDVIIMSAAVADYTPVEVAAEKIKKSGAELSLHLTKTRDILAAAGSVKRKGQILVGFALETTQEEEYARSKLEKKNLDYIVLNSLRDPGAGFAHDTNKISILDAKGGITRYPLQSKTDVAKNIFRKILEDHDKPS
jgi:phosphopantothenoylcysteine decarboxylase/phosphopantothenate--cysteine ligase